MTFKKIFSYWFILALAFSSFAHAFNDEPDCFKRLKTTFFDKDLVYQALSMHNMAQSQWESIYIKLQGRVQNVPQLLAEKTARMIPSPLDYPFQVKQAEDLLFQILFDVFNQAVQESQITKNSSTIRGMFNYIRDQQIRRLEACLGPQPSTSNEQ
jgi:hypothetical protein